MGLRNLGGMCTGLLPLQPTGSPLPAMTWPVLQGTPHHFHLPGTVVTQIPTMPARDLGGFSLTGIILPWADQIRPLKLRLPGVCSACKAVVSSVENHPLFVHESPANILANKFRKPETLIIKQRQTHSNNINNKVPFQRCYSTSLPVAGATKNTQEWPGGDGRGNDSFKDHVLWADCGLSICYSRYQKGRVGRVIGRERKMV